MKRPTIEIVVARADNGVIGKDGQLPWHLPKDLRHFKSVTMGAPMIMGRKTFESLPGRLPGRRHIVLTNSAWWQPDIEIACSIEEALEFVESEDRVSVIGGAAVYRHFLPLTDKIHMTEVHMEPAGDVFFPEINRDEWVEIRGNREPAEGRHPSFSFVNLLRKSFVNEVRRAPLSPQ